MTSPIDQVLDTVLTMTKAKGFSASSLQAARSKILEALKEVGGPNYNVMVFSEEGKVKSHEFGPDTREACEDFVAQRLPFFGPSTRMGITNTVVMAVPMDRPIKRIPIERK